MEGSFISEDLSLTLPTGYGGRESDQLSVSSSSSVGGPSPRDRRCLLNDSSAGGIYLPMAPLSSSLHSSASNNKVSPTPPKKPPRRNLSVSPTHLQTQMSLSADSSVGPSNYEYLFLARSGARSHIDLEQLQKRRDQLRHVTRSVDQYVEMKSRLVGNDEKRESNVEPVAITSIYENRPVKMLNPRRKLRRHAYENYEPENSSCTDKSPCSDGDAVIQEQTFVSSAFLTLKSSQESLLDERREMADGQSASESREATDKRLKRVQMMLPTSPTHYVQPPTPDHPPPSALQAEKSIHERIRPLSQVYKRRSRDMETETDEDLLQFPTGGSLNASSGSLSSVSLSDKSMSTDNVEEYFGDVPFAGLLKGSVTAERPRTLRRLRNVYGQTACGMGTGGDGGGGDRLEDGEVAFRLTGDRDRDRDEKSLSIMSPFDEQEEWAKISEIMASFGTGLVRESVFVSELEKEFQTRLGLSSDSSSPIVSTTVGQWLSGLGLADYESLFINYGFDDLEFINGVLDESDLCDMGISSDQERAMIMDAVGLLNKRVEKRSGGQSVEEWLKSIRMENYAETFRKHLYTDMDRVKRIWEVELAAVLEIQKPAHRKRILASVSGPNSARAQTRNGTGANLEDLNKDLNTLKTNIQQLKEEIREKLPEATAEGNGGSSITSGTNSAATGTLRHRKNRPAPQPPQRPNSHNGAISAPEQLEIRAPSELLFGVPSTLKTQWRHQPKALVTGCVTYVANYLGSTVVKELRGTESTKKSIQKLKKTFREPRITPDITLAISYRGVRFLNTLTNEPICEHEIRNIHCACQDADDLTHFAYITKDHASRTHFCHVFCVPTMDQATEVILTLGQAFEVAYQMALKDKLGGHAIRSQSANQLATLAGSSKSTTPAKMSVSPDSASDPISRDTDHIVTLNSTSCANPKMKSRSKSIPNPNLHTVNPNPTQDSNSNSSSSSTTTTANCNPSSNFTSTSSANSITSSNLNSTTNQTTKPLVTHGRSHSVNDIKVNGNQLKLAPVPVDDIGIGVKDMKPGSRAPIALSEEL